MTSPLEQEKYISLEETFNNAIESKRCIICNGEMKPLKCLDWWDSGPNIHKIDDTKVEIKACVECGSVRVFKE